MKLHTISENNEYEDLDDIDEFDNQPCIYCGIGPEQDEIIDFNGERVCTSCAEERPVYEWIMNDPKLAQEKILKYLKQELERLGEDFEVKGIRFEHKDIIATFMSETETSYYSPPDGAAKHLAEKITKARKTARERHSW